MKDLKQKALKEHEKYHGKLEIISKKPLNNRDGLTLFYTPGVAFPCKEIEKNPLDAYKYTMKSNTVAVITDGSAVLGLGNIGALAGLPVMEGKCALFKEFGGVNAFPICLGTQDTEEIISVVKNISLVFGGINLEDISAPRCFEVEERLKAELDIPVFHDDQHGTAIVCLAGLINGLKVTGKKKEKVKIVISGAGAAGMAICKLLLKYGFKNIILLDSVGTIYEGRSELNIYKEKIAKETNREKIVGGLAEAISGADVFIGVSKPNILTAKMVKTMNEKSMVFAMSNPDPEITPEEAKKGGAFIIATGRSDYPNQINNVLAFPGIFKGALKYGAKKITDDMKIASAEALAKIVKKPSREKIIPGVFEKGISDKIALAVKKYC
ncbi:MAG: NADP-dependent malic enzyme [Candidatus Gracilibacteria bacterium]|jgi:malate dehydrogenase (oxaloacetate-decarboxylating)